MRSFYRRILWAHTCFFNCRFNLATTWLSNQGLKVYSNSMGSSCQSQGIGGRWFVIKNIKSSTSTMHMLMSIESIFINNINIIVLKSCFKRKNESVSTQNNFSEQSSVSILLNSILLIKTSINTNNIPNSMNIRILKIHQYLLL